MRHWNKRRLGLVTVLLLLASGAGLWLGRKPLLTWYYLRGLARAEAGDRDRWAERVAGLDRAALPGLIDLLGGDERARGNSRAALDALIRGWGADDPRSEELAHHLSEALARLGPEGQREVFHFETAWLQTQVGPPPAADVARALVPQLTQAGRAADGGVRGTALDLAAALLARPDGVEWLGPCRDLVVACFTDASAENRSRAARLALHPGMDIQQQALPLLHDAEPEVRRLAILVVGPAQNVISTDDLLHWLHDPDPEVRRLCEVTLGYRKVPREHIRLGRTLTDPDHHVRLNVLDELHQPSLNNIDAGIWLRYLSHDPKESVRVAAVRAAVEQRFRTPVDLSDRLEEMAKRDPSPTVRQEAGHYLSQRRE